MKRITLTICAAATLFFYSCNDDSKTEKTTGSDSTAKMSSDTSSKMSGQNDMPPMDSAAMMKAWQDYMTPGGVHEMLAKSNGTWTEDVTAWMDPSKPPMKSTGTAVNTMMFGGRYQRSHHTGDMMGQKFEGEGTLGYDNAKKMLVSTWIDNMGTGMMYMEGTWDSTTHSATMKGKMVDPMSGGKEIDCRQVFTMVDDKNQKLEMWCTQHGKEMKTMEIMFKKK